ncbi:MAG: hypothetical protein ABR604_06700 [Jatrophihabitantaceae bacterium]
MLPDVRCVRRSVVACAALALAAALLSCGGKHHGSSHASATSSAPSHVASRWWSNAAVAIGSPIDPAHPDAAAAALHASQADYCGMLKQTLAAQNTILSALTDADPTLVTRTRAFVAEIERVAPAGVSAQWQVLGPAAVAVVESGGDTKALPSGDLAVLTRAGTAITVDAQRNCGVDLSGVIALLGGVK